MPTRTCHFKLTGKAFTKIVRDFVLDDEPDKAWRIITEGLLSEDTDEARAMVKEVALGVLSGVMTLTGDETKGIGYKKTKPDKKYLDRVRYLYAGRWRHKGKWYRPVGVVTVWTPDSGRYAVRKCGHGPGWKGSPATEAWAAARLEFYCEKGEISASVKIDVDDGCGLMERSAIFEPCGEPPAWYEGRNKSPQEALDDAISAGRVINLYGESIPMTGRAIETATEELISANRLEREDPDEADRLRELAYAAEDELRALELARIGEAVRVQAAGDTISMTLLDGRVMQIPRLPFICWAMRREHPELCPAWKPVSPSGLKMMNDDPYHSDWVLGAIDADGNGISLDNREAYADNVNRPAWDLRARIEQELRAAAKSAPHQPDTAYSGLMANLAQLASQTIKATTIVNAGNYTGIIGEDVVVLPDLSPLRVSEIEGKKAIIAEQGGELCHIAIVAGGLAMTVMRVADACNTFQPGMRVVMDPVRRTIVIDADD